MSGFVRLLNPLISLLAITYICLSVKQNLLLRLLMLLVLARTIKLQIISVLISPLLLLFFTSICLLAMPKKYSEQIITFCVIDSHWKCIDPKVFSGTLADFLALLGIDYLPDSLEFARLHIKNDFYIWIYNDAIRVRFKLFNKPSNFLQHEQNS